MELFEKRDLFYKKERDCSTQHKWKDSSEMNIKEVGLYSVDASHLVQRRYCEIVMIFGSHKMQEFSDLRT